MENQLTKHEIWTIQFKTFNANEMQSRVCDGLHVDGVEKPSSWQSVQTNASAFAPAHLLPFFTLQPSLLFLTCRHNYKEYSMESRTQFRIHAALAKLKADPGEEEDTHL